MSDQKPRYEVAQETLIVDDGRVVAQALGRSRNPVAAAHVANRIAQALNAYDGSPFTGPADVFLLDDYSPDDENGVRLRIFRDVQGDMYLSVYHPESGFPPAVRIAQSGTRYSPQFRSALATFLTAAIEEARTNPLCPIHIVGERVAGG